MLRPDIDRLTRESLLEAALIHTRCVAEFLRRSDGEDAKDPARNVVVARDYVPTWHWTEGEPFHVRMNVRMCSPEASPSRDR